MHPPRCESHRIQQGTAAESDYVRLPVNMVPFDFQVNALDNSGGVVGSYAGTVHFASTDTQAVLPADTILSGGTVIVKAGADGINTNGSIKFSGGVAVVNSSSSGTKSDSALNSNGNVTFGAGLRYKHLGVDYAAPAGTPVQARLRFEREKARRSEASSGSIAVTDSAAA